MRVNVEKSVKKRVNLTFTPFVLK